MERTLSALIVIACLAGAGGAYGQVKTPDPNTPRPGPSMGGSAADEAAVKEQLRAAGFTSVHDLKRNPDGTWEGRATKENANVAVLVDTAGNVMMFQ